MSEGPTTVGSIDAKLTIDSSQFDRKAEEAKVTAHELGALSPDIKVDADVAAALAKFAEVGAAEHAMTSATDKDTQSKQSNANAARGQASAIGVLIALSPAILAAAAPIAAGAVGLGVAFGVMGAAGIAAFAGIKQAMAVGDTAGNQYAAGVAAIKQNLDGLAGTAANGMLSAFNSAVGTLNGYMPFLNQTMGTFSSMLGNIGGTVLRGVLTGLQQMNPLLNAGGVELGKFVSWLMSFAGSTGFQDFIRYAIDNLPSVMSLIENLVSLAGNLITAFAPLGPVVLTALNGLVTVLNSLPLPMLAGLVTTATTLGVALQFVGSAAISGGITAVAEAIGLTGVMANLAVPVVGILLAAVAGLAVAAASSAAGQQTATQATLDYTQALKEDNDAIGKNTELMAAKKLSDDGAFKAASELGISQRTLTQATLGNADAQKEVADKIAYAKRMMDQANQSSGGMYDTTTTSTTGQMGFADAIDKVTNSMGTNKDAIAKGLQTDKDLAAATDTTTGALSNQQAALQAQADQYGATVQGYQAAETAQQNTATQLAQTTLNMQMQDDAAGLLTNALTLLNGGSLSLAQATTGLGSATNSAASAFQKNGTAIDGNSAAALANQSAIQQQVQAAQQQAEATAKATGKTEDGTAAYGASKVALENALRAQGQLTPAVQAYIDKLYDVNNLKVAPTKLEIDKAAADAAIEAFKQHLASINDRHVQVTTDYVSNGKDTGVANTTNTDFTPGIVKYNATGGQVSYLAGGGTPFPGGPKGTDTVPTWLTPGEIVMNTAAVSSLGAGNLLTANRTGQWPGQSQQAPNVTVYVTNPFTGEQVRAVVQSVANAAINGANRDARYRRAGVPA
jgi:hypothetical protein